MSRAEVRLYPAHTQTLPAKPHPYAEALLAELTAPWRGSFVARAYDQGFSGCTDGLQLSCQPKLGCIREPIDA